MHNHHTAELVNKKHDIKINNGNFSGFHRVALLSTVSGRIGIWKCCFLWREENQILRRGENQQQTQLTHK